MPHKVIPQRRKDAKNFFSAEINKIFFSQITRIAQMFELAAYKPQLNSSTTDEQIATQRC
jgi:hypothetical protein